MTWTGRGGNWKIVRKRRCDVQPGYGGTVTFSFVTRSVSGEVRTLKEIVKQGSPVVQIWKSVTILLNKRCQPEKDYTQKR